MNLPDEMNAERRAFLIAQIAEARKRIASLELTKRELQHELRRLPLKPFEGIERGECLEKIQNPL